MTPTQTIHGIVDGYFRLIRESLAADEYQALSTLKGNSLLRWLTDVTKSSTYLVSRQGETGFERRGELFVPASQLKSGFEIRFDRMLRDVGAYWDANAPRLLQALNASDAYAIAVPIRESIARDLPGTIRRLGIYFDSILLVDPIHIPAARRERAMASPHFVGDRIVLAHRLSLLLGLESLVTSDTAANIFVVIPDFLETPPQKPTAIRLIEQVFGFDPLRSGYFQGEQIELQVRDAALWEQIQQRFAIPAGEERIVLETSDDFSSVDRTSAELTTVENRLDPKRDGMLFDLWQLIGDALYIFAETTGAAIVTGADPIIYAPDTFIVDWFRRDIAKHRAEPFESQAIAQALLHERTDFLEAVSLESLKRLRQEGVLEGLRRQLRLNRSTLRTTVVNDVSLYEKAFVDQLFNLMSEHGEQLEALSAEHKRQLTSTVAGMGVSVAIGGLSLLMPPVLVLQAIAAGAGVVAGGKTILDLASTIRHQRQDRDSLSNSPIGLLYGAGHVTGVVS